MDELIAEFLVEARENLDIVDVELVKFEAHPNDAATLNLVFRLVHTIKGTCGFLGLQRLGSVAHAAETLLGRFRDGALAVTPAAVTLVLEAIDRIKLILAGMADSGAEPEGDDSALVLALEAMSEAREIEAAAPAAPADQPQTLDDAGGKTARAPRPGEVSLEELEAAFNSVEPDPPAGSGDALAPTPPVAQDDAGQAERQGQSIRVGVDVLEDMMTLVSELVLTRNQLLQVNRQLADSAFGAPLQRLSAITGKLQDSVMKTRMQPIGAAWKKLPRLVRDLAKDLGKQIELVTDGENTELDRQVLELIRDPLTHLVRNSADHGLETAAVRSAAGKSTVGRIRLSAFHEGGSIVIRIADDGAGLNAQKIKAKALEQGLIGRADVDALSDAQIYKLIFAPGFSTADAVTSVSGRGVGMDVVRTNIEAIGGQIEIQSQPGVGATFTIKIPLTLAIIPALIVGVAGQRFALPQGAVLELARIGETGGNRIEALGGTRLLRLRQTLLPLIDLASVFELPGAASERPFVVVMQVGDRTFGVTVEQVFDTEEIVVKPLAATLREAELFSGATILGDGSVVLIVEPNALGALAGLPPCEVECDRAVGQDAAEQAAPRRSLLLVRAGPAPEKAVDLSRVTRLEMVPAAAIEVANGHAALQYRGRLTPVIELAGARLVRDGAQPLLVFAGEGFAMALAVDEIIDVVEHPLQIELRPDQAGSLGAAVVAGRAVEAVDVDHYLLRAAAEQARQQRTPQAHEELAA